MVEESCFCNAFDYNQRVSGDYLQYTVNARGYWNYENEMTVECLELSSESDFFGGWREIFLHKEYNFPQKK